MFPLDFPRRYEVPYEDIAKNMEKIQKRISNEINKLDEKKPQNLEESDTNIFEIAYANSEIKTLYEQRLQSFRNNLAEYLYFCLI